MKILIMGLPGSGKTTLAEILRELLWQQGRTVSWFNADSIRKQFNDWDFSKEGRLRQSQRMKELANASTNDYIICDFVAPMEEMREMFNADYTVWMDTIPAGRFSDTNAVFTPPTKYNLRVNEFNAKNIAEIIVKDLINET